VLNEMMEANSRSSCTVVARRSLGNVFHGRRFGTAAVAHRFR